MTTKHVYNLKPDRYDGRDHKFAAPAPIAVSPIQNRIAGLLPPDLPFNQAQQGSCTGNAGSSSAMYEHFKKTGKWVTLSRDFLYYNERLIEGTTGQDAGASIRDCMKALNTYGICPEAKWDYETGHLLKKPTKAAYMAALPYKIEGYQAVAQTVIALKTALQLDMPPEIGITVYESFESNEVAQTGIVPMPKPHERILGGHAQWIVGSDDTRQAFHSLNSWGRDWGDGGFCWIPYAYLIDTKLARDFWVINP